MISRKIREEVFERDNHQCTYCGTELSINAFQVDHLIPRSIGGKNTINNLVLACAECNNQKAAKNLKDFLSKMVIENSQYHEMYLNNINSIGQLLDLEVEDSKAQEALNKMLFSNVITAMETYLSDAFINTTLSDSSFIKNLVESDPEFKKRKFNLSEIFITHDTIKDIIKDYLLDIIYHNIFKVKNMYERTLNVSFPDNLEDIQKMIMIRHDIVHRNGKSKQSIKINIDKGIVIECITIINNLIEHIDNEIKIINKFSHNPVVKKPLTTQP